MNASASQDPDHQQANFQQEYERRREFAALFEEAPMFMALLHGPQHHVEFVNPGYRRLIGHRDIIGRRLADELEDAAAQGYVAMCDQVYRTGEPISATGAKYAVQALPGGPVVDRYVDFVLQPVRDRAGAIHGIFLLGSDVTDRVCNEIRRDALIRLTDLVRDTPDARAIMAGACRILGETLGASRVGFAVAGPADTVHLNGNWQVPGAAILPDTIDLRQFGDFIDDLKAGTPVAIEDVALDPRTAHATASLAALDSLAFVDLPVLEDGRLVALVYVNSAQPRSWTADDVALVREVAERTRTASERLTTQVALAASEAKFRTIANAMPQMVWSTLPDGFHDYYNARWYDFTGVVPGETDGAGWANMFHPDDRDEAWARWSHSLASGDTYEVQYRLRHHTGGYRWVLGRALPVRDDADRIIRWMGTCTDIHDQKLAENELRLANQRKDEFLAMLAHELRNPLAPISTAAQVMRLRYADAEYVKRASDIIGRQVRHMTDLVDDLLDVSRVTRGLVQMERAPVDLKLVINGALEQARPLIEARHHALDVHMTGEPAWVGGDRTRLTQAVSNLLNNAAKYTQQHGRIDIGLAVRDGHATLSVRDNGSGIAPGLLPHVFDLFTQGERTPDRAQGGLGLGLTLVKSIAVHHGGSVQASSGGQGQGSSFTITLPTMAAPAAHGMANPLDTADAGVQTAPSTPRRIVIVDDNRDAGASLAAALEARGHGIALFDDAQSLLDAQELGPVDAYILDIGLPDIDGYQLARRLRQGGAHPGALLVALTGYGQAHDFTLSKAAGFDHHLVKPADLDQLERILRDAPPGGAQLPA
ncbi:MULTISPECIES: ATP-binding protein [unclassified Massilia]|uniref:hybrid sensor histidine kinase/response regulator n=1 Tax=unclassified Massilia TaxID=2609279 RepID=UPI00177FEEA3|nr:MULTISPECIES: ATP-binding protein [unclassified Massilia]MBD8533272.1 PAS domain-containing protein [Massilia sp. CFBP 13647]MBD8676670.1 PAS domain-containing protein [Massilia sp. CFBP 13721]